jgi:hypothetical protein
VRDAREHVLARRVGQQHRFARARVEPVDLLLLVSAGIPREDQHVRRLRPPAAEPDGFREIGQLGERSTRCRNAMQLCRIAGTARNDELALLRMPADGRRRLELGVRRNPSRRGPRESAAARPP